jgi:DnaJ-class molecular chaperone
LEAIIELNLEDLHQGVKRTLQLRRANGLKNLTVNIAPGARDGSVLRLAGKGEPGMKGGPAGDLYLHIRIRPHPKFSLVGKDDLEIVLPVTPWEASLGFEVSVATMDGPVKIKVPPNSQNGKRLRLRGKGLSRRDGSRGDQYVKLKIVVPSQLGEEERAIFKKLKMLSHFNPRSMI